MKSDALTIIAGKSDYVSLHLIGNHALFTINTNNLTVCK